MQYQITYSIRASKEYLDSLRWYKQRSIYAAENFVRAIDETLKKVSLEPTKYKNTYKQFYEVKTNKFPFSIVYFIDHKLTIVVVVSIFHHKRNPRKKFIDND